MRILIIGGISRSLINFRGPLIRAMLAQGHEVVAVAGEPRPEVAATLQDWGVQFEPVKLSRAGMRPWEDCRTFFELRRLMRRVQPDIVFAYTIKPVIWGGFAARCTGVRKSFSLITGLGYAFSVRDEGGKLKAEANSKTSDHRHAQESRKSKVESRSEIASNEELGTTNQEPRTPRSGKQRLAGWVAKRLYKLSLKFSTKVFFQNPDDMQEFVDLRLVAADKCAVVSGSGVDIEYFQTVDRRRKTTDLQQPTFLLIARLLWDKGIGEYVQAAKLLKTADSRQVQESQKPKVENRNERTTNQKPRTNLKELSTKHQTPKFLLAGALDPNPASITQKQLDAWTNEGTIEYLGYLDDVRAAYQKCSVYVLPSYREGTPRTVLEAMSMGRPIITTDAPGCRETVRGKAESRKSKVESRNEEYEIRGDLKIGANGILIPPRNAEALAEAMQYFIENPEQIAIMGHESRRYVEERYDVHKVNAVMLNVMGLQA